MKLSDLKWLFHTDDLIFQKSENPFWDYWIFDFDAWKNTWKTWEHALFSLKEDFKWRKFKALSIASNDDEWIIKVGTKISESPSEYKKNLINLKKWDKVKMRWPFGSFYLQDQTTPVIMIAWWIWITPFRAMMLRLRSTKKEVVLLYSSNDWYLFEEELNNITKNNSKIKIQYISDRKQLELLINDYAEKYKNNAYYFISGLPKMIKTVRNNLKKYDVKSKNMFNDSFQWY